MASGASAGNPNAGFPKRNFDDLARRELDVNNVAGMTCFHMPHAKMEVAELSFRRTGELPKDLFKGVDPKSRLSVEDLKRNFVNEVH